MGKGRDEQERLELRLQLILQALAAAAAHAKPRTIFQNDDALALKEWLEFLHPIQVHNS